MNTQEEATACVQSKIGMNQLTLQGSMDFIRSELGKVMLGKVEDETSVKTISGLEIYRTWEMTAIILGDEIYEFTQYGNKVAGMVVYDDNGSALRSYACIDRHWISL